MKELDTAPTIQGEQLLLGAVELRNLATVSRLHPGKDVTIWYKYTGIGQAVYVTVEDIDPNLPGGSRSYDITDYGRW